MSGARSGARGTAPVRHVVAWTVTVVGVCSAVGLTLLGHPRIGLGIIAVGWYPWACWRRPFRDCWCCDGTGKHYKEKDGKRIGKTFKRCWWCAGTSARLRIGRRVYNKFEMARRRAK